MSPTDAERERRVAALHGLLESDGLDVLLLASNDYRGHKGTLRWIADYNLTHRYGLAVVSPGREPELLLPQNLAMGRPGNWRVPTRYVRSLSQGLVDALRELRPLERIGVVGLAQVMKVEDYLAIRHAFPDAAIVDVSESFERIRAIKSDEELEGVREATRIAEQCFERLLNVAKAGVTERAVGAEMYRLMYSLGGEDPLFLTMTGLPDQNGRVVPSFGPPGDRELRRGDQLVFSFELIGPLGYWMELARMVVISEPSEIQVRMNSAVRAGMAAGEAALHPGARPDQVQRAILDAVAEHGGRSTYWSGHGLGQDVIEEPWIGLGVVQDRDVESAWTLAEGMVLAIHPFVSDNDERGIGYMADSYIVSEHNGGAISKVPLDLHVVP